MEYGNCYLENMHFGLCNRQLACHRESELYPIEFQKPMNSNTEGVSGTK